MYCIQTLSSSGQLVDMFSVADPFNSLAVDAAVAASLGGEIAVLLQDGAEIDRWFI